MKSGNPVNTPLLVGLLMHYYCKADPPPNSDAPAVQSGIRLLLDCELIEEDDGLPEYCVTERGCAHIQAICKLKLPEIVWQTPSSGL